MRETKLIRSFGLIVGGIFVVMGVWPWLWGSQSLRLWRFILGGILIVLALAWPRSLAQVYRCWMAVGEVLGWINTRLILSGLFYPLFTPMGWYMRLRGQDPMRRTWNLEVESYRVVRQPRPSSHMGHQF